MTKDVRGHTGWIMVSVTGDDKNDHEADGYDDDDHVEDDDDDDDDDGIVWWRSIVNCSIGGLGVAVESSSIWFLIYSSLSLYSSCNLEYVSASEAMDARS